MRPIKNLLSFITLCLVTGISVGSITTLFGNILMSVSELRQKHILIVLPFLTPAGLLIIWIYYHYGYRLQQGMHLVLQAAKTKNQKLPLRLIPLVIISTCLTHLFGGSAGREGVAVQIGATTSHFFSKYLNKAENSQLFTIAGMAAGFAGLFQTPIAAIFFAFEVSRTRKPSIKHLIAAILCSFSAYRTSQSLGLEHFSHTLSTTHTLSFINWLMILVLGVCFGVIGMVFVKSLHASKSFLKHILPNPFQRIFWGSLLLTISLYLLHTGRYSGLGTNLILASLTSQPIYSYDWLLKATLTIWTLSIGFQGGEVTPLFAIGASSGAVFAIYLGLPIELAAALGYCSVFAAATQTWLAPLAIFYEVFGKQYIVIALLIISIAKWSISHNSIYDNITKK